MTQPDIDAVFETKYEIFIEFKYRNRNKVRRVLLGLSQDEALTGFDIKDSWREQLKATPINRNHLQPTYFLTGQYLQCVEFKQP